MCRHSVAFQTPVRCFSNAFHTDALRASNDHTCRTAGAFESAFLPRRAQQPRAQRRPACVVSSLGGAPEAPSATHRPAILIVDHGSKRTEANDMLNSVKGMVAPLASGIPVYTAHMELAEPTIADAFDAAVEDGARHVVVVPFFLAPGRHVTKDIPELAAAAAAKHPDVSYSVKPPLGTHPSIADVVLERADITSLKL